MNKKATIVLAGIFLFLYFFNYLHPMSFGDDYLYSFIWQGKPMYTPLSEDAARVSSWHELFVSQWSHYLTWSGRAVAHVLIQFFLWMGKGVFNFFNALAGLFLVVEIYWCIHKGKVSFVFNSKDLCWIFFVLWAFSPGFTPVFFWLTGACNYLWTGLLLIGFILPYIQKYYGTVKVIYPNHFFGFVMFVFGIIAGWGNENSVCWIVLVLALFIIVCRRNGNAETWMYAGLAGLVIGYALLMLAPGNVARLQAEQGHGIWVEAKLLKDNFNTFLMILFFQIFLWFFSLRAIFSLKNMNIEDEAIKKEIAIVRLFYFLAFVMSATMMLSPGFPARSGFPGTIQLVIAAGILLRIQEEYKIDLIQENAKKFLLYVGLAYFVMTTGVTAYNVYLQKVHMQEIIVSAQKLARNTEQDQVLEVKPFKELQKWEELAGGFHIPDFELSENENSWINVAFARYFGIKGVRMIKDKNKDDGGITTTDSNTENKNSTSKFTSTSLSSQPVLQSR
jgi:hypothetical protein